MSDRESFRAEEIRQTTWEFIFNSPTGLAPLRASIRFPNPVNEQCFLMAKKALAKALSRES